MDNIEDFPLKNPRNLKGFCESTKNVDKIDAILKQIKENKVEDIIVISFKDDNVYYHSTDMTKSYVYYSLQEFANHLLNDSL